MADYSGLGKLFMGLGPRVDFRDQPGPLPSGAMVHDLQLTPQEYALYQHGRANQLTSPVVNGTSSISTIKNMTEPLYGGNTPVVFPSIYEGQDFSNNPEEAMRRARAYGPGYWPSYPGKSYEEADARYNRMHEYFNMDTDPRVIEFRGLLGGLLGSMYPDAQ